MASDLDRLRDRIYASYVYGRNESLAPPTLAGLRPRLPYLRKLVKLHFPQQRDVDILELGCGHGALLHVLQESGYTNARGVDRSIEQVTAAEKLGIAGAEQGDVMEALAKTPAGSLDVIVAFDVIEHFRKDELLSLVDEVHRALRPGGRWIIHVPNAEAPFGSRMRHWDITHELAFTRTSIAQLLIASGFASVECFEDRPTPHGPVSASRLVLWQMVRACLLLYLAIETGSFDQRAIFSQNMVAVARKT